MPGHLLLSTRFAALLADMGPMVCSIADHLSTKSPHYNTHTYLTAEILAAVKTIAQHLLSRLPSPRRKTALSWNLKSQHWSDFKPG